MSVKFPKSKTTRSDSFLAFVRALPCSVCESPAPNEAHHVFGGGKGLKCSDLYTISLCRRHHHEHDSVGKISFYKNHNLDKWELVAKTMEKYILETGLCSS